MHFIYLFILICNTLHIKISFFRYTFELSVRGTIQLIKNMKKQNISGKLWIPIKNYNVVVVVVLIKEILEKTDNIVNKGLQTN